MSPPSSYHPPDGVYRSASLNRFSQSKMTNRDHIYDKYYYFSPRYRRTQFHRHYYHGRLQFDPIEYGAYRYYDPYRRYYDPYHDSYIKLYDYRSKLMDSLY
uniref:Uncharacterized protein n=1 Tax=Meloidogyne hapla TaxID=6305 RepID=A0A1I8BYB7_MELHA